MLAKSGANTGMGLAALAELCHDALAEGVLAKHDGLPESWLAMFKAHPAAWAQLQKAVLAPTARLFPTTRELTMESTAFVSWYHDFSNNGLGEERGNVVVPVTDLPEWLFLLLEARLNVYTGEGYDAPVFVDSTGAYSFVFKHPYDIARRWKEVCDHLPEDEARACEIVHDMFVTLDTESPVDLFDALARELSMSEHEIALNLEDTIKSNLGAAAAVISETLEDGTLFDAGDLSMIEVDQQTANREANYFRAPALSLHFDWTRWGEDRLPRY